MLHLTPMSESRVLRMMSGLSGRVVKKVSARGLSLLLSTGVDDRVYVINRNMIGTLHGLGPDDECSIADLRARGVRTLQIRCNQDRDVLTVTL